MEKKVFTVMWYTYCPNGCRSYSREFETLEEMRVKFNQVLAKPNCYAATALQKVRSYDPDTHIHRVRCTVLDRVDKY